MLREIELLVGRNLSATEVGKVKGFNAESIEVENIINSCTGIDNNANGNPRYYIPIYMLPQIPDSKHTFYNLKKYLGKKYGAGYVIVSYYLKADIERILARIDYESRK